ncbi:MAG: hypothetical protein WCI47_03280 [bacterium]
MIKACPNCHSAMVSTDIGFACPTCGERIRFTPEAAPYEASSTPQVQDAFGNFSEPHTPPLDQPAAASPHKIVNHHKSSQYTKRLHDRLHQLEELELEAPVRRVELQPAVNIPTNHQMINTTSRPEPTAIVPTVAPEQSSAVPNPNNNSDPTLTTDEQNLLNSALKATAATPHPSSQMTHQMTANDRAEALLAEAAAAPQSNGISNNYKLIALSVCLIVGAAIGGWFMLQPPKNNPAKSPVTQLSPTITTSPSISSDQQQRDKQRKSDLNSLAIGVEAYKKATGTYPAGSNATALEPLTRTSPPYITSIPNDPLKKSGDTTPIQYGYSSNGASFTLSAVLENTTDPDSKNGLYIVRDTLSE